MLWVLTELWIEEDGRAKTMASLTGGGAGAVLAGGVLRWFSGRLDSAGRLVVLLHELELCTSMNATPKIKLMIKF